MHHGFVDFLMLIRRTQSLVNLEKERRLALLHSTFRSFRCDLYDSAVCLVCYMTVFFLTIHTQHWISPNSDVLRKFEFLAFEKLYYNTCVFAYILDACSKDVYTWGGSVSPVTYA